jgi:hypothetical protein
MGLERVERAVDRRQQERGRERAGSEHDHGDLRTSLDGSLGGRAETREIV